MPRRGSCRLFMSTTFQTDVLVLQFVTSRHHATVEGSARHGLVRQWDPLKQQQPAPGHARALHRHQAGPPQDVGGGLNQNKAITKRLASAGHYQQVCNITNWQSPEARTWWKHQLDREGILQEGVLAAFAGHLGMLGHATGTSRPGARLPDGICLYQEASACTTSATMIPGGALSLLQPDRLAQACAGA